MRQNMVRLWLAIKGQWKPDANGNWGDLQPGRKSDYKGYLGEIFHAAKNAFYTEPLRASGIYDRPSQPDGRKKNK